MLTVEEIFSQIQGEIGIVLDIPKAMPLSYEDIVAIKLAQEGNIVLM